jgi:hypothetical protein
MNAVTPVELSVAVRDYIAVIPDGTRQRLLRAAVLRWFDEPLLERVLQDLNEPVDFEEFISLPVIARTSRNTYSVISTMKEELARIFWEESPQEFARATLTAADYFHRPLDEVPETEVSGVVEEIAYLSRVDPDGCAERLAGFGVRAVLSGWVEAAGRASMVVEPAIERVGGSAYLTTTARLLESIVTAIGRDGRLKRPELRSLNSLAKKAERADYATEVLLLLAALARGLSGAKKRVQGPWWRAFLEVARYAGTLIPLPVVPEMAALAAVARPAGPSLAERLEQATGDAASEPRVKIGAIENLRIHLEQPTYQAAGPAWAGSALFVAMICALLVVSGAGTGALLHTITTLSSAWVITGIFCPTALFFIVQLGIYLAGLFRQSRSEQDVRALAVPATAASAGRDDEGGDSVRWQIENP